MRPQRLAGQRARTTLGAGSELARRDTLSPPRCNEMGYLPLETHGAHMFFQFVSSRY